MDTSAAAYASIREAAPSIREEVFALVAAAGEGGMTCDDLEAVTGRPHTTISGRLWELSQEGRVERPGETRKTRQGRNALIYYATGVVAAPVQPLLI